MIARLSNAATRTLIAASLVLAFILTLSHLATLAPAEASSRPVALGYTYDTPVNVVAAARDTAPAATTPPAKTHTAAFRGYRTARKVSSSRICDSGAVLAAKAGEILPKPLVGDAKLQNYVDDLYKGTTNPGRIGTGTTADAVRAERATGQPTFGKFHTQKAEDTARGLGNWLRRNPGADPHDRLVAQSLRDELLDALGRGR